MAKNYTSDWMAASLTPVSLPSNRQTKVPGLGMNQMAARQSIMDGAPNDQFQDDAGAGAVSTAGISENVPGKTMRLDECTTQAQDSGSNAASVPFNGGTPINLGAPGWSGEKAQDASSPEYRSTKAALHERTGNKDIGVAAGMLFPGIIS